MIRTLGWAYWPLWALLLALSTTQAEAAGERLWVRTYGYLYAGSDYARGLTIDENDNVIIAGQSLGWADTYFDYAVIKYSPAGAVLWKRRYSGPTGYDEPFGVAVDREGNVIVTGLSFGTRGIGLPDITTVKYSGAGQLQWVRRYYRGTAGHEAGRAVTTDLNGNVYVAGIASSPTNNHEDAVLIKYSPGGKLLWARVYDAPFHDNDGYFAVTVDGVGNAYATGYSTQSGLHLQDLLTVKYDPAGNRQWMRTYDGEESFDDWAESIAVDKGGNTVVTGARGEYCGDHCYSYATVKYSPTGVQLWARIYDPQPVSDDLAHAVKVDSAGNVYVTGESAWKNAFYDFATLKYAPNGTLLWSKRYNGLGDGNDSAYGLALDSQGNAIVGGYSYVSLDNYSDHTTVKYAPTGQMLWVRRYNGAGSDEDRSYFVGLDSVDSVYAVGFTVGAATAAEDFVTIKYRP